MSPEQQCWKWILLLFYILRPAFNNTVKPWNWEQTAVSNAPVSGQCFQERWLLVLIQTVRNDSHSGTENRTLPGFLGGGNVYKKTKPLRTNFYVKKTILKLNWKYVYRHTQLHLQPFPDLPGLGKEMFDLRYPPVYLSLTYHWPQKENTAWVDWWQMKDHYSWKDIQMPEES